MITAPPATETSPPAEPRPETGLTVPSRVNDASWSLAMALAWITYRTETAVADIQSGNWPPNNTSIRDLLSALRAGRLPSQGMFEGERTPHAIETAVWTTFEIIVKPMRFIGHAGFLPIVVAQRMGVPQTRLLDVTAPAAKVRKLWPAARASIAAEIRCQAYLVAEMRRSPERQPKPKRNFFADRQARFPGLSARGFERAWANAKKLTGAARWGRPGRPSTFRSG